MKRWKLVQELFLAGRVAAGRQLIAILLLTIGVRVLLTNACSTSTCDSKAMLLDVGVPLLAWSFLLTAMGCALTHDSFVDITAERMRRASQNMRPSSPKFASRLLLTRCSIAAAALAVAGLTGPPVLVNGVWCRAECGRFIQIVWPAVFSIGVATFGASAHAAYRALHGDL